jgi:hypothetical protein
MASRICAVPVRGKNGEADEITFVLYRFRSCMLPFDFARSTTLRLAIARQINFPVPGVHLPTVAKPPPASRSYEGGFVTALAHKDLDLAVEAARHVDAPLYVGRLAEEIFRKVRGTEDWDARDFSIVYKWLEEKSGAE